MASTAIQLLDDRKSPIVAGNNFQTLFHSINITMLILVFKYCAVSYVPNLLLSCRDPDEARVLSEEVLDCMQTGNARPTTVTKKRASWRCEIKLLLFFAQCTALDGKCSISCDNEVRTTTSTT